MERDALRLECLKLAVSKNHNLQETLAQAKEFVEFVTNETKPQPQNVAMKIAPHIGNAKP